MNNICHQLRSLLSANHPRCLLLLQSCTSTTHFFQIHAQMFRNHLFPHDLFASCQVLESIVSWQQGTNLQYAQTVFDQISHPNIFAWNTIIRGYANSRSPGHCLWLFNRMMASGSKPNSYTYPLVLKACASLAAVKEGEQLHGFMIRSGADREVFSVNGLINMYSRWGKVEICQQLFDNSCDRDVVTWNSIISAYWNVGLLDRARKVFDDMPERGVITYNIMINGYTKRGEVDTAREFFDRMPERNVDSWNTLIAGYATCGLLNMARELFDEMPRRNGVSWSAMITAYAQQNMPNEALCLFEEMNKASLKPNWAAVVSVLSACAQRGALEQGKSVHRYINSNKMRCNSIIGTALIDMYAKCGCIQNALGVFNDLTSKDVISWTAMIGGLAVNGHGAEALELFSQMEASGVRPNEITFVGVLCACSHRGLVELAKQYLNTMTQVYHIEPQIEHYGCMVDALGRAGFLREAVSFIESVPASNNGVLWLTLLGACTFHGNVIVGEYVVKRLEELNAYDGGTYVLLSNIYAMKGKWHDAKKAREAMEAKRLGKCPGRSSFELDNAVHDFYAGDKSHPRKEEIYQKLEEIVARLKLVGYAPSLSPVLYDLEEEESENALFHHSEKLAVAFGLLSTDEGTTIRIVKNLRICHDCHVFVKLISKEFKRDIIMRDRTVFHHLRDGSCSCKDYW